MKPLARYAALNGYGDLSRSLGLDPGDLLRRCGLDPAGLGMPDRWVPAVAVAALLERSARESGHEDFGLQLAERRRFSNLGPVSLVVREEPDVRSMLRILSRYEHMYNESLRTRLTESGGTATIRVELDLGEPAESRQAIELAVAVVHRLLRGFLGADWRPIAVCFAHHPPADTTAHRRVFGTTVTFDHEFHGLVFSAAELAAPNRMADPGLHQYAYHLLESVEPSRSGTVPDRVRELIEVLLPTGRCSIEQVARSLGVNRRTIHRRLAAYDLTFSSVLDETRAALAERMLAGGHYTLTEISELLSFSAPSNFTRWFRGRYGCSPSRWRADQL
ncbi:MAG: AraC family transcriptional regulator [Nocardioides sp.]|uniref:AraC family transcriptional regulator n=1 Tax=Nocardioides sp. TaxID=35761 RepID=UPI003D6B049F